ETIKSAHDQAASHVAGLEVSEIRKPIDDLNKRITEITAAVTIIEGQLSTLAEKLIAEATVVAATLTCAYLRDAIQARKFDTVVLDEASMAPIPALWIAAGLATANVVAVGDFKQLPPIVLSEHELAKQGLGRDIFEVAGITEGGELDQP